jgi:hypothetical protein
MNNTWRWIIVIGVGLIIIALLFSGGSDRQAYWIARGSVPRPVVVTQVENVTAVRYPCATRVGSINTSGICGFYVWKR